MDTQVVKSGSAEHNRQNGHKKRNDDPQCNRNLPAAPEGGFAEKPPADVSCQQTGNGKKYEKKQNHANPYGIYPKYLRNYFFAFCGKIFTPPRHQDATENNCK
jgi:hypothetical protein